MDAKPATSENDLPKATECNDILDASKIRSKNKLTLRRNKMISKHNAQRLEDMVKSSYQSFEINIEDIIALVTPRHVEAFNVSDNKIEYLLDHIVDTNKSMLQSTPFNINDLMFSARQLRNYTQTLNETHTFQIDYIFTMQRYSSILSFISSVHFNEKIVYELSYAVINLLKLSRNLAFYTSEKTNINRLFTKFTTDANESAIYNSILHIITTCTYEDNPCKDIIANTQYLYWVTNALDISTTKHYALPIETITLLISSLGNMIKHSWNHIIKNEFIRIAPSLFKFLSTDMDMHLFYETLICICNFGTNITTDEIDSSFVALPLVSHLVKYVHSETEFQSLSLIINILVQLTYLHDDYIEQLYEHETFLDALYKLLTQLNTLSSRKHANYFDFVESLLQLLHNMFCDKQMRLYCTQHTKIVNEIADFVSKNVILIHSKKEITLAYVEVFLALMKHQEPEIMVTLLSIKFVEKVLALLIDDTHVEYLNAECLAVVLEVINICLSFGDNVLG